MRVIFQYNIKRLGLTANYQMSIPNDYIPRKGMYLEFSKLGIKFKTRKVQYYRENTSDNFIAVADMTLIDQGGKNIDQMCMVFATCGWNVTRQ